VLNYLIFVRSTFLSEQVRYAVDFLAYFLISFLLQVVMHVLDDFSLLYDLPL
jgi:hypothetical protein